MQNNTQRVVVLGTGGTIAGVAQAPGDNVGYVSAQLGVMQLVEAIPPLASMSIEVEQVAQLDSKDMNFDVWRALAERVSHHLAQPAVTGVVITHGTDTLEETAYFLQRVLAPTKPVVLAAAMRPATGLLSDGRQNLLDAVRLAQTGSVRGVMAVLAGRVHGALDVRKVHPYRLDSFDSGDSGVLAHLVEGVLHQHRPWPGGEPWGLARLPKSAAQWPWVELLTSCAGSTGLLVRALCAANVRGLVVAGTGNGSLHHELEAALLEAQAAGVRVLRCSRCLNGAVIDAPGVEVRLQSAGSLTPVQARIEMMLLLLAHHTA